MNLSSLLSLQAEKFRDSVFLAFERQATGAFDGDCWRTAMSYAGFDARVNQAARFLRDAGIKRGDVINLHLPNSPTFLLLWFAATRIGAIMMPTNVQSSVDELVYLLQHSGSKLTFCTAADTGDMTRCADEVGSLDRVILSDPYTDSPRDVSFEAALDAFDDSPIDLVLQPQDLAAIMYTSGTTSRPKGVMVTHANYIKAGETVADAIQLTEQDRHFVVLPLFHGNAQYYSTMSALLRGASVALMDRFSASRYFDKCIAYGCTVASLFSAPIRMILAQPENAGHQQNQLRAVLYAQNLEATERADWQRRFSAPLCQLWGMTETMGPPLMNPLDGERRNHTVGLPIGGYDVRLVDEAGAVVEKGQVGEIVVQGEPGASIMQGYFENADATAETIRDGWLYTGDNAVQDDAGYFRFVDRKKDMIKRSGENVSAGEVEGVLVQHPAVFEAAVVGLPDPMRDERIVAVVVLHEGIAITQSELIAFCAERLAKFRVPEQIVFESHLPRTSVGKIQKHIIRNRLL